MKKYLSIPLNLFLLALMFLPWDSFKLIPFGMYKPISLIFLILPIIYSFFFIGKIKKISKALVVLIFIYVYACIIAIYKGYLLKDMSGFNNFFISFLIGLITFMTSETCFNCIRQKFDNLDEYVLFIISKFTKLAWALVIIGYVELMSIYGLFPKNIMATLSNMLTGHYRGDRIQLLSYEPSWAGRNLIILLIMIFYLIKCKKETKHKILFILLVILLLTTLSFEAIAIIIVTIILYLIFIDKNIIKIVLKISFTVFLAILLAYIILNISAQINGGSYFVDRFNNILKINNLREFIVMDASTMIRILHPYIAILMFFRFPLFGVGGGNYPLYYDTLLKEKIIPLFPEFLKFPETFNNYINGYGNSKCMYTRIFAEMGIIGVVLLILFLLLVFKQYKKIKLKNKNIISLVILVIISSLIQFDSYNYLYIWIILGFISSLKDNKINYN